MSRLPTGLRLFVLLAVVSVGLLPGRPAVAQSAPPEPLPIGELSLPEIRESQLGNGLQIVLVERRGLPLLTVQLVLPGGQSLDPPGWTGVSQFAADLLVRGTTSRGGPEVADTIEQVGGSLVGSSSQDSLTLTVSVLSDYTDLAFELLGDVALNPTFPEDELERYRQRALTSLRSDLSSPSTVASRAYDAIVYGEHPYGNLVTEESLRAITRDDVAWYYAAQLDPSRAFIVVIGDLETGRALDLVQHTFASWAPTDERAAVSFPSPPTRSGRTIYLVDRPGSSQAEILLGHLGIEGAYPERYALVVANQVLGGGASSRLFVNLREQKGYTYGIYSWFTFPPELGTFNVGAAIRNEVIEPAVREILAELETLRTSPLPAEDLAAAKSYLIGSYALRLESNEALANQIVSLKLRNQPLSLVGAYSLLIESQTEAVVHQAAQNYVRPEEVAIVVVGDASSIGPQLANLGPVVRVDANGRPVG